MMSLQARPERAARMVVPKKAERAIAARALQAVAQAAGAEGRKKSESAPT
jgi:hypothetical protein